MANTFVSLRRLQRFYAGIKNKFALKSEVPTKTSDLTNDSGFLTSHQDISGKVNIYQGTANQNKYLGINESGNVEPRSGLAVTDNNGTVTIVSGVDISGGGGDALPDTTNAMPGDFLVLDNNKEPVWKTVQSVMGASIPLGN